ncbi:TIGR00730 family Rossman fold protein [Fodinicurvata halophila]|uniref:Cytokinin riboside 5'-monophosphate phosphoribohydrolase n=2 Tax=Fodinicurvata halophila TaxID=1419723 RepID=A0ABV8UKR5_9PROT
MPEITSLCVYCGSSKGNDPAYVEAARELGYAAAARGIRIVFGGGRVGLMGELADAVLSAHGEVLGIIPRHLMEFEVGHNNLTDLRVVESMHERKFEMFRESDAFCILPGGFGTLDETFEMITWGQLGLHAKPVGLLNVNAFWAPLVRMLEHQAQEGFIRQHDLKRCFVAETVEDFFTQLETTPVIPENPKTKWS